MCQLIDQLASERGMKPDDANYIFSRISDHLVTKIPALKQVIEDVFSDNTADDKLQQNISKTIILLQQHGMKSFQTWKMPHQSITRHQGSDRIL
jgi:hypothetical protein